MGQIETGRYYLTNVRYLNRAVLPNSNRSQAVISRPGGDLPGEKWNVVRLPNGKYHIQNYSYDNYATCSFDSDKGDEVFAGDSDSSSTKGQRLWIIRETRIKGQWTIRPSDSEVFWGVADGEECTPLTFGFTPNDPKNQWKFDLAPVD